MRYSGEVENIYTTLGKYI